MYMGAYLILRGLDASVVVLSTHNQHQAAIVILGSPHMVEGLGRVPVQALLPAILLTQPGSGPVHEGVIGVHHSYAHLNYYYCPSN